MAVGLRAGQVEWDAHGRATRFPGVVIDITDRKLAETVVAHLTEESDRQRRLYEGSRRRPPTSAYVFSLDHRVLYANDSLISMWGAAGGPVGKTFLEIGYEPWHAEMHGREIDRSVRPSGPSGARCRSRGRSGGIFTTTSSYRCLERTGRSKR